MALWIILISGVAQAQQIGRGFSSTIQDGPLVTDLSSHLISITSSFTGTDLLIFGAVDEPGDIIIVLRGPQGRVVVREKQPVFGIWVNRGSIEFNNVPGYYAVAASRPLSQITNPGVLARLQIGVDTLRLVPRKVQPNVDAGKFRAAILRRQEADGLLQREISPVTFLGPKLFRAYITFPAVVPTGTYRAEVYLLRDDQVISAQATPLFIKKSGAEQIIYDFAHYDPVYYGLIAIALALLSGWLAATVLRRT